MYMHIYTHIYKTKDVTHGVHIYRDLYKTKDVTHGVHINKKQEALMTFLGWHSPPPHTTNPSLASLVVKQLDQLTPHWACSMTSALYGILTPPVSSDLACLAITVRVSACFAHALC